VSLRKKPYGMTTPCAQCPFRNDIPAYLTPERVVEIDAALVQSEFHCHKTTEHDDESGEAVNSGKEIHCAGALILLEKMERPSQMMRIAERLGMYDRTKLDMAAPVFESFDEMVEAQEASQATTSEAMMERVEFEYEVFTVLTLSRMEVGRLSLICESHYDGEVQGLSKPGRGAVLNGARVELDDNPDVKSVNIRVSYRQLDSLCKATESVSAWVERVWVPEIHEKIVTLLREHAEELRRLNS
jgi:hypothetical protein